MRRKDLFLKNICNLLIQSCIDNFRRTGCWGSALRHGAAAVDRSVPISDIAVCTNFSPPAAVATRQALHRSGTAAASEPAPHLVPHADNELKTLHEIAVFNNI